MNNEGKMKKHKAKRLSKGLYLYRGFQIECVGYYQPEHRVCWEAVEENGINGWAHHYTLKDVKREIDDELDKK